MSQASTAIGRALRAAPTLALLAALSAFWLLFHLAAPGTRFRAWNVDPELTYLFAALAALRGAPYAYVEHPGMPLTLTGAALLRVARALGAWPGDAGSAVLARPEPFFVGVHALLGLGCLLCVVLVARGARLGPGPGAAVLAAACAASFFAVQPHAFFWTVYWSHNALAFPLGAALLALMGRAVREGALPSAPASLLLGLGAGTLAASQLYFAAWVAGAAALPLAVALLGGQAWRRAAAAAAAALAGGLLAFAAWTLPMRASYPRLIGFVRALVTHQGLYGAGPAGVVSASGWAVNLMGLLASAPALFALLALLGALVAAGWARAGAGARALALVLLMQAGLLLLAFGKHPSPFYLPALAAHVPALMALAFAGWSQQPAGRLLCAALAVLVLAGFAIALGRDASALCARLRFRTAMESAVSARLEAAAAWTGAPPLLLWAPGIADARCYSLWSSDQYVEDVLAAEVARACPSEGMAWSNRAVVPPGRGSDEPALLVGLETTPRVFPAFAALGAPELSDVRDPSGARVAFFRVAVRDGRMLAWSPRP